MLNKSSISVGYVSSTYPKNILAWSGTMHRMFNSLEKEFTQVVPLGPLKAGGKVKFGKLVDKAMRMSSSKRYNYRNRLSCSRSFARELEQKLSEQKVDVLFAPAGSVEVAELETDIPICYLSDSSFEQMNNYYDSYSGYSSSAIDEANSIESKIIDKADAIVYPSKWAADFSIDYFKAKSEKVHTIPFGANIDMAPSIKEIFPRKLGDTWKLLLLGVSWERKGGSIALDALKILLKKGYKVELTVCGCIPPISHPNMKVIPFLNKNLEEDKLAFEKILSEANLLLLPTRAEAYGVVFCEASAYGVPSITTSTGGTTSAVYDGKNGYALPLDVNASCYAEVIEGILSDELKYEGLCKSSRALYDDLLNWEVWGSEMRKVIEGIV